MNGGTERRAAGMLMQRTRDGKRGFSLVEALLAMLILGLSASGISALYMSGIQAVDAQDVRAASDSCMRGKMEELLSTKFNQLSNGSQSVTVCGKTMTLTWTASDYDINGDSTAETSAKQLSVTLDGRTLTCLAVKNDDRVLPIP
jgi:prepilin-type N-terminal cleavage/methylation domain-containing protein